MTYYRFDIHCDDAMREILPVILPEVEFEGFEEHEEGLYAYIPADRFSAETFEDVLSPVRSRLTKITRTEILPQNWNALWESDYEPVIVDDRCIVRASFHEIKQAYPYDILINPKMSFGTGHHDTTKLMLQAMLDIDFEGKSVFDYGTGTGVLAIMARLRGAGRISTNDTDPNCAENAVENFQLNDCADIEFRQGDLSVVPSGTFDIILANITRNIVVDSLPELAARLNPDGLLLTCGFYTADVSNITAAARKAGLSFTATDASERDWALITFKKKKQT